MKIYVSHSSSFDFKNELYLPLRRSKLNEQHEIILPHEKTDQPFESRKIIPVCDLIVAEVSFLSTGEGIELGWASAHHIPIVCIYKIGNVFSTSLKMITDVFLPYENAQEMIEKLSACINEVK